MQTGNLLWQGNLSHLQATMQHFFYRCCLSATRRRHGHVAAPARTPNQNTCFTPLTGMPRLDTRAHDPFEHQPPQGPGLPLDRRRPHLIPVYRTKENGHGFTEGHGHINARCRAHLVHRERCLTRTLRLLDWQSDAEEGEIGQRSRDWPGPRRSREQRRSSCRGYRWRPPPFVHRLRHPRLTATMDRTSVCRGVQVSTRTTVRPFMDTKKTGPEGPVSVPIDGAD